MRLQNEKDREGLKFLQNISLLSKIGRYGCIIPIVLLIIALFFLVGLWMLLIGVGKLPFCHLRNDLFVKIFVVFFIAIWGIFFVIVFLDSKGIKILP